MKLNFKGSPILKNKLTTEQIMLELTVCLLFVFGFSLYYYSTSFGSQYAIRALIMMGVSIGTAVIIESLWAKFYLKTNVIGFLRKSFPWVTAIILVLTCSIATSYYAIIIATIAAIVLGKLLFGGFGKNIFNPAAVGRAIIFASFVGSVAADFSTGATPTGALAGLNWSIVDGNVYAAFIEQFGSIPNIFFGFYPGAIGETFTFAIILCGIYLSFREIIDWRIPVFYVGSVFLFTWFIALAQGMGTWYPLMHIGLGGLMFGAVFMATDPVTAPTTYPGRIIYAVGLAFLTVLIRVKANLPEGVLFSLLIMNMLTPMIESWSVGKQFEIVKKNIIIAVSILVLGSVMFFFVGKSLEPVKSTTFTRGLIVEEIVEVNI